MNFQWRSVPDPFVGSKELRKVRRLAKSFKNERAIKSTTNTLRSRSDPHPLSNSNFDSRQQLDLIQLDIERPLMSPYCIPFDKPSPLLNFFLAQGWKSAQICRIPHTTGFQAETVACQICGIHDAIPQAIGMVLNSIQTLKDNSNSDTFNARLAAWQSCGHNDEEHCIADRLTEDDDLLWEIDSGTGYQVISLNPETGQRRDMVVNTALSNLLGMHREELLTRLANHDLPPPYLDVDSLLVFLFTLLQHPSPGRRVKYVRMRLAGRCVLVRWITIIVADGLGRITEVRLQCDVLPPSARRLTDAVWPRRVARSLTPLRTADPAPLHWRCRSCDTHTRPSTRTSTTTPSAAPPASVCPTSWATSAPAANS